MDQAIVPLRAASRSYCGAASAGMSSGGGSKNYSNWTPEKYDAAIAKHFAGVDLTGVYEFAD